jgi:GAF domain-containing protein
MSDAPVSGGNPFKSILDVGSALASSTSFDEVLANVARCMGEAMMVSAVELYSYDAASRALTRETWWNPQPDEGELRDSRARILVAEHPDVDAVLNSTTSVERHAGDQALSAPERDSLAARGYRATLEAPLRLHGLLIGMVTLAERRFVRRFTPVEQETFLQLCDLAAHAVGNARLYRRQQAQSRRVSALVEACRALSSSLTLSEVVDRIAQGVVRSFGVSSVDIYEYVPQRDEVRAILSYLPGRPDESATFVGTCYSLADHPAFRRVFEKGCIAEYHVGDEPLAVTEPALHEQMREWGEKSVVEVGLLFGDAVMGLLSIGSTEHELRFNDDDRQLLTAFAATAATAVHNARLFARLEEQQRRVATMVEIGRTVTSAAAATDVLDTVARLCGELLGSPRVLVYDYDAGNDTLRERAAYERTPTPGYLEVDEPTPVDELAVDRAILACREPLVEQVSDDTINPRSRESMLRWGETTCLNVPLVFGDETVGILMLLETGNERAFTADELRLAEGMGRQAAVALKNLHLGDALIAKGVDPESVGALTGAGDIPSES